MIREMFEGILHSVNFYFGGTGFLSLFLVCMIYLLLKANKQEKNYMLYPFAICLILVIFNPAVYWLFIQFVEAISYFRVFWLLLIPIIIAFCIVKAVFQIDNKTMRGIVFSLFVLAIISLNVTYEITFAKPENLYKIPTESIQVATILSENGTDDENTAVVHFDLFFYIRQYDATIDLTYSRRLYQLNYVEYESVEYTNACWLIDRMLFYFDRDYDGDNLKAALETTNTKYIVLPTLSLYMQDLLTEDWINEIGSTNSYTIVEVI